jgi:hypothetical protein
MIFRKKEKKEQTLEETIELLKNLQEKIKGMEKEISVLRKDSESMLQKIGLVRFNPFSGTGGDQSFSLALLDKNNNGVVITSFYTSEGSSVYGKPIENKKSCYVLSEEEKESIRIAVQEKVFFEKISVKKRKK